VGARIGTALFWLVAGSMHFIAPKSYEAIVPPPLDRYKREVVQVSGVAELVGALGVMPRRTRRAARWWLLATLVAVYPANIYMALRPEKFRNVPAAALYARLPVQFLFGWLTWRGTE
jgi:uncharacterized membrane protein